MNLGFTFAVFLASTSLVQAGCTTGSSCSGTTGSGRFNTGSSIALSGTTYYCCLSNGKFCTTSSTETECPSPTPPSSISCPSTGTLTTADCEFRVVDLVSKTFSPWVSMVNLDQNTYASTGMNPSGDLMVNVAGSYSQICGKYLVQSYSSTCAWSGTTRFSLQSRVKACPTQVCYANGKPLDWYCDLVRPNEAAYESSDVHESYYYNDVRYKFASLAAYTTCVAPPPPTKSPPPPSPPPPASPPPASPPPYRTYSGATRNTGSHLFITGLTLLVATALTC